MYKIAFTIRLTTIRVVCQNTLAIALKEQGLGEAFRRRHYGSLRDHVEAARDFYSATLNRYLAKLVAGKPVAGGRLRDRHAATTTEVKAPSAGRPLPYSTSSNSTRPEAATRR